MYKQREIVLVPFPYADLSNTKRRPVLIVSSNDYSILLEDKDLELGILPESSVIKVHKLFTISKSRIIKKFSLVRREKFRVVFKVLTKLFKID